MLFGTREMFGYLRCDACGTIRIKDIPDDLARYYPAAYYAGVSSTTFPSRAWAGRGIGAIGASAAVATALFGRGPVLSRALSRVAPPVPAEVRHAASFTRRVGLRR